MADSVVVRGARLLAAVALALVIVVVLTLETVAVLIWEAAAPRRPLVAADETEAQLQPTCAASAVRVDSSGASV